MCVKVMYVHFIYKLCMYHFYCTFYAVQSKTTNYTILTRGILREMYIFFSVRRLYRNTTELKKEVKQSTYERGREMDKNSRKGIRKVKQYEKMQQRSNFYMQRLSEDLLVLENWWWWWWQWQFVHKSMYIFRALAS